MCWPNYFFRTALTKNQDFCRTNSKFHDSYKPEFYFHNCAGSVETLYVLYFVDN